MSVILDVADQLQTHIEQSISADQVAVVVDRQKDIANEVKKNLGKISGGVAVIEWGGLDSIDGSAKKVRGQNGYTITLICKPIIRATEDRTPSATLVEQLSSVVHHWHPEPDSPRACRERLEVVSISPINNPKFLIYSIRCQMTIQLP